MDWNHYNGPQMTPEQIHAYLDRIACPGPIPLNLAGLTRLLQAHQQAVPFENLDVLAGRPLSLDHEALFDKIVRRRQGGLCAELNTCFNWLLYSLGFPVFSYHTRICNPHPPLPPTPVLGWCCRRGATPWMGASPWKMPAAPSGWKQTWSRATEPASTATAGTLSTAGSNSSGCPAAPGPMCWALPRSPKWTRTLPPSSFYTAHSPDSNMNQFARVSRYTHQGILAIRRHVLQEEVQGQVVSARPLSPQEEGEAIRRVFHLDPTGISLTP